MEALILTEIRNHIAFLTINRPQQLNALNKATIEALHLALSQANDNPEVGVIILTGSGQKAFVAGADIKEFANYNIAEGGMMAQNGQKLLFDFIEQLPTPVIAAVNGFALGGGLELAMACHIRIASSNAKMGLPETSLGVIPGYGGTQRLAQLVGKGKANELIFTAGMLKADEALQWGLVNAVVEQEVLIETAEAMAQKILNNSPMAIAAAIRSVNAGFDHSLNGYHQEIKEFGMCFGTKDFKEGTQAFLEKRKPQFRD